MSINNMASFKLDGELTIQFNPSPPATAPPAPGAPPPPPADGAPPAPPGGQAPPRQDDAAAPTEQSVRDETVDAAQNLMGSPDRSG